MARESERLGKGKILFLKTQNLSLRGEESPFAGEDGDEDVVSFCNVVQERREMVVEILVERIEFALPVQSDESNSTLVFKSDGFLRRAHDGSAIQASQKSLHLSTEVIRGGIVNTSEHWLYSLQV
jgi:hypothetical protein